jgi:hypothetical protein
MSLVTTSGCHVLTDTTSRQVYLGASVQPNQSGVPAGPSKVAISSIGVI